MVVMKFGGTSVGKPESMIKCAEIVEREVKVGGEIPLVVVSAYSKITDLLLEAAARRELAVLQAQARTAEDPLAYADLVRWVKLQLEALRRPAAGESARGQLLGWLAGQHEEPA